MGPAPLPVFGSQIDPIPPQNLKSATSDPGSIPGRGSFNFFMFYTFADFHPFLSYFYFEFERKKKKQALHHYITMVKSFQKSPIKKLSLCLKCNIHFVRH